jgi:ParB-like chromosome segregation protein Spo0J
MTEAPLVAWPIDKVERRATKSLTPNARNARVHSAAQVRQIAALMDQFGWTQPVLIDEESVIIAGHGRILAAELRKFPDVPVIVARGWTEEQKRAYALADNKIALNAGWDNEALFSELGELTRLGVDMGIAGFSKEELERAMDVGESRVEEVETTPVADRFWISIRGPLADQARVLDAIKAAIGAPDGEVEIDVGSVQF